MKDVAVRSTAAIKIKSAAIDPNEWLMSHSPVVGLAKSAPEWLEAGGDAIAAHGGCVVSALSNTPDLRVEIVLAHILDCDDISDPVRERIYALADAMYNT